MKRIILVILLVFIIMISMLQAEKAGVLSDVLKPECIEVSKDRLYVVQGAEFLAYSLAGPELIAKFGRKGEGPGELKVTPLISNSITALDNQLFIEGLSKVMYLTKDAQLVKEIKKTGAFNTLKVLPVGENYAAIRMINPTETDKKHYLGLALLDGKLGVLKMLYKQEFPEKENDIDMVTDSIHFAVYKDKIYVEESTKGFFIEVFDSKGNKLSEIKKQFDAQKITGKDKEAIFKNFEKDGLVKMMVQMKGGWENFKKSMNFIYPDVFPHIQDIIVTDDKIYVSTFERKDGTGKYIVMDLKGNILGTPYLPIPEEASFLAKTLGRDNRFYGITQGKFYYLKENEETEEWELHSVMIK
jgi:hypothetical protein